MQHECNMAERDDAAELGAYFDELIEEMLAHDWSSASDEDIAELVEITHAVGRHRGTALTLPLSLQAAVLDALRRGIKKRGKRDSEWTRIQKHGAIEMARELKAQLVVGGMRASGNNGAEEIAAQKANDALQQAGLKPYRLDTLIDYMNRPSKY